MAPVYRNDPYGAYNFLVIINGISDDGNAVRGGFSEVSGLEVEVEPFTNIILKRGVIGDLTFWNWMHGVLSGNVRRADGAIVLLDENRAEVLRWNFRRGWPCKWTGPDLNAKGNDIAIETLEICHEGLSIDGQT